MISPELVVLNLNKNYTGVSSTASAVIRIQEKKYEMKLVGYKLPNCSDLISIIDAFSTCKKKPRNRPFIIWHVRRNIEIMIALWARDALKLPIRIVFTSAAQRLHSRYPRWLISKVDAVIATTPEAAKFVPKVFSIIPHGVDTKKFYPAQDREKSWGSFGFGGKRGVATIGRIRPEKGTDIFVDAMIQVLPRYPDMVVLIVGKSTRQHRKFQKMLEDRILQAGLSDRCLFVGEVAPEKMPLLIRSLSLLITLPRYEGYGMTPLEGLASGVPFVGSDTGYFKEFSNNGEVGTVVPCEDSILAAKAINDFASDSKKLSIASKTAIRLVAEKYDIKKEVSRIGEVYERLWCNEVAECKE